MKKKLIAIVLGLTLLGGIGTGVVILDKHNNKEEVVVNAEDDNIATDIISEKDSSESNTAKEVDSSNKETIEKNNSKDAEVKEESEKTVQATSNSKQNTSTSTSKPSSNTNKPSSNTNKPSSNNSNVATGDYMSQVEQAIYKKVNEERAKAGVQALSYNNVMEKYARIKSKDMGDRNYFDHKDPEGNLITVKMKNDGVSFNAWGENIAYIGGISDPTALANQFMINWMNSSGHRKNILSTDFNSIGIGVVKIGNKVYATQEFYR